MKNLLIFLTVQCGEYSFDLKILHHTKCEDVEFAANYYAAHFYDNFYYRDSCTYYFNDGEVAVKVSSYRVLTTEESKLLSNLLYI